MKTRTKNFELGNIYWTKNRNPEQFKIIEIKSARLENGGILIEFLDGGIRGWYDARRLSRGQIVSPYSKTVFGVGYIGEGEFKMTNPDNSPTRVYNRWKAMLQRCYDVKSNPKSNSYKVCEVSKDWLNFQNFAVWITKQHGWEKDWQLDKDLLKSRNGLYSPENCCLIPSEINQALLAKPSTCDNGLPCGVGYHKKNGTYVSHVHAGDSNYQGSFATVEQAWKVAKKTKEDYIKSLADKYKGELEERVYLALNSYEYLPDFVEKTIQDSWKEKEVT